MAASSEEILTPAEKQTQTDTKLWESDLERSDTMETSSDHHPVDDQNTSNSDITDTFDSQTNSSQAADTNDDSECVRQTEFKEEAAVVQSVATNETNVETVQPMITNDMYREVVNERDKVYYELQASKQQLEAKCFEQQEQFEKLEGDLDGEKKKVESAQNELNDKLEKLAEYVGNQDALIAKLAILESEKVKLLDEQVRLERIAKDSTKETERLQSLTKGQKSEIARLSSIVEKQETGLSDHSKEIKKMKEDMSSINIRLKWAQNKLKAETEAHKDTKSQLSTTTKKLNVAKEEGEQIRQDLKQMIAQYQDSEEMRSNTLDVQLRKKEAELLQQEQEISDQQQLHDLTVKELELARESLELSQKECQQLKTRVSELTNQITDKQLELDTAKSSIDKEKKEQKKQQSEISSMKEMNKDIEKVRQAHSALRESHSHLQKTNQHLEKELGKRKEKEAELLAFSEKLSQSNAQLLTEKGVLEGQNVKYEQDIQLLTQKLREAKTRQNETESSLIELKESGEISISTLRQQLHDKSRAVEQLTLSLDEEREQILALKRKHANNIRDMQRQIQLYSKRIEQLESSSQSEVATLPVSTNTGTITNGLGMRTASSTSLDGSSNSLHVTLLPHNSRMSPDETSSPPPTHTALNDSGDMFQTLDHEKSVLVEKICQLKRKLARREDKLEFYEGHSEQLTQDIKNKSRIIQNYILREEIGVLTPPEIDAHKINVSKKSGIMASVFTGHVQKGSSEMTLALSLEINRKMQAVLEDTLLKNITLKENLSTLGSEVAKLSSQLQTYQKSLSTPPR